MVAKDAAFLISLATEEFIRRLAVAGHDVATKENRTTMKLSDIVAVSKRIDEFIFLEGMHVSVVRKQAIHLLATPRRYPPILPRRTHKIKGQ